jgi:hypothetical protein
MGGKININNPAASAFSLPLKGNAYFAQPFGSLYYVTRFRVL